MFGWYNLKKYKNRNRYIFIKTVQQLPKIKAKIEINIYLIQMFYLICM